MTIRGLARCAPMISSLILVGCSGSSGQSGGTNGTGGSSGIGGGTTNVGGVASVGGTSSESGATSTGGAISAAGGAPTSGGANTISSQTTGAGSTLGGTAATGGKSSTNGSTVTGGTAATGGKSSGGSATGGATPVGGKSSTGGSNAAGGISSNGGSSATGGKSSTGGSNATGGKSSTGGSTAAGGTAATGGGTAAGGTLPAGWLYTNGSKIYVSDGAGSGTQWMGRGVNTDDLYLCGYNYTLWMDSPEQTLQTMVSGLLSDWKPTFIRMSLSMDSFPTVSSLLSNAAQYKTPMTNVINSIGAHPGVYVLVTLRTDASMVGPDEATQLPTDSSTTSDATAFPTGTDATYVALVDSFANSNFVLFGISNEPGGNSYSNSKISAAMKHAVGAIRAEEDRLGVPHHLVSVQGNGWTSDISFYSTTPLTNDNVVYEVHGYPPSTSSYTFSNIPVIIGEYGSLSNSTTFYADLEAKQIPNLAWDFDAFSDCAPDLLTVNQNASNLVPTTWGTTVKNYLLAHAQ